MVDAGSVTAADAAKAKETHSTEDGGQVRLVDRIWLFWQKTGLFWQKMGLC